MALLLPGIAALAQQADVQTESVEVDRSRLLFIDSPVAVGSAELERAAEPLQVDEPTQQLVTPDPEDDPEFIRRMENIRQYEDSVQTIEGSGGAWDQGLVQELTAMGSLLQQQGAHGEAIDVYERAVHLNRINSGLNTVEQVPFIEQMISSYVSLGNWEQVDLYNDYLFYIQQKAYGFQDPRIIPVLENMATWHVQAFRIGYGDMLGLRLSTSQMFFDAAAKLVGVHFGKQDERYISNLRKSANSAYLATRNSGLMAELDRPDIRNRQQTLRQQLNNRVRSSLPRSYDSGEEALQEIINYHRELGDFPYDLAEAITNLGDWYLLFGQRHAAQEQYTAAWEFLAVTENAEELRGRLFGQVIPLPAFFRSVESISVPLAESEDDPSGLNSDLADFMFDVSSTGMVRNISMLTEETEENAAQLSKLRRTVRNSVFRPIMRDGETVSSEQNYFRYRYWY